MCTHAHMFRNTCVCKGTLYCSFFMFLIYGFYSYLALICLLSIYILVCIFILRCFVFLGLCMCEFMFGFFIFFAIDDLICVV